MDSHYPGIPPAPQESAGPHGQIERSLAVLERLTLHANGLGLFEIADQLQIPRSATHRILTVLAAQGYVRQDRYHGAYRLTAKIASLGFTFLAKSGVTDLAQPILDRLARESGELVRLAIVDERSLTWVAKAQGSPYGLRYDPEMGQVARLSCSAGGMAWLLCMFDEQALDLGQCSGLRHARRLWAACASNGGCVPQAAASGTQERLQRDGADFCARHGCDGSSDPPCCNLGRCRNGQHRRPASAVYRTNHAALRSCFA